MKTELTIEKVVYGGDGLARHEGKAVFVPGAVKGEKVLCEIIEEKKNFARARILEILAPSPARVEPPCSYVEHCGGCQYQHMTYAEELRTKEEQVREAFTHTLKLDPGSIAAIRHAGSEYGYRQSVTLHRTSRVSDQPQPLGFIGLDNATPTVIRNCLLVDPGLEPVFAKEHLIRNGERKISFKLSERGEIITDKNELFYRVRLGNESILASSEGFFQSNLAVTELVAAELSERVRALAPHRFIDLYAGAGTFTLLSARDVPEAACAEESKTSVACLRINLREKHKGVHRVLEGRVEETFPKYWNKEKSPDAVVFLDPPRQGMHKTLADFFAAADPPKALFYLSCDLGTLVRDLGIIVRGGKLRIENVVPFDMFPRTKHIETLVSLVPAG